MIPSSSRKNRGGYYSTPCASAVCLLVFVFHLFLRSFFLLPFHLSKRCNLLYHPPRFGSIVWQKDCKYSSFLHGNCCWDQKNFRGLCSCQTSFQWYWYHVRYQPMWLSSYQSKNQIERLRVRNREWLQDFVLRYLLPAKLKSLVKGIS